MKYRKRPIEIEAEQYTEYGKPVKGMCNSQSCHTSGNFEPHVHTIHNNQVVNLEVGDFVIPEPDGEHYYPCKANIFHATYEPVKPEPVIGERSAEEILYNRTNLLAKYNPGIIDAMEEYASQFKEGVGPSADIDEFLQSYYGEPKPTGERECEYDNLFNLLATFKKRLEGVVQKEALPLNFWKRLEMFVENVQVNDPMSEEEKEMILMVSRENKNPDQS